MRGFRQITWRLHKRAWRGRIAWRQDILLSQMSLSHQHRVRSTRYPLMHSLNLLSTDRLQSHRKRIPASPRSLDLTFPSLSSGVLQHRCEESMIPFFHHPPVTAPGKMLQYHRPPPFSSSNVNATRRVETIAHRTSRPFGSRFLRSLC
jgi:hypothetical protein